MNTFKTNMLEKKNHTKGAQGASRSGAGSPRGSEKRRGLSRRVTSFLLAVMMVLGSLGLGALLFGTKTALAAGNIVQSGDVSSFTNDMKLTDVTIDLNALNPNNSPAPIITNANFAVFNGSVSTGYISNGAAYMGLTESDRGAVIRNPGQCFYYVYKDAATLSDRTKADVIISYSDVNLYVSEYAASSSVSGTGMPDGDVIVARGTDMRTDTVDRGGGSWYVGVEETATVYVVKNGTPVEGNLPIKSSDFSL